MPKNQKRQEHLFNKISNVSSHDKENLDKEKAYRESKILLDREDGMKIVVPLTEFSSHFWGKDTTWSTSAENRSMFEDYAKKAPLYIIIIPNNIGGYEKLLFWSYQDHIQFINDKDIYITEEDISQYPEIVDILKIIDKTGLSIQFLPKEFRTKEFCELAVRKNGLALMWIPKELKTREICEISVRQNGLALYHVPEEFKTKEICKIAVRQNGNSLVWVTDEFITKEICEIAVRQNGEALEYVPKNIKSLMNLPEKPLFVAQYEDLDNFEELNISKLKIPNLSL